MIGDLPAGGLGAGADHAGVRTVPDIAGPNYRARGAADVALVGRRSACEKYLEDDDDGRDGGEAERLISLAELIHTQGCLGCRARAPNCAMRPGAWGGHRPATWAYRELMKTKSPQRELAYRLAERDELVVEILELEGRLARATRRLEELSAEIKPSGHVE
ncbi:hypothetical protein W59_14216 [Rhodococcus opacus RKJ300 = JCM 13270]|uniref:Uncharacterized protein n=2 Tax=Nocardiaceae TaxID=85025 RepID=I0WSD5_RHOOP|nr:hypothetical protein W59_14216 [Rhodococcus opacus RKJ300 = JCM 13270]